MLELHNVRMKPLNVRKKVRELPNVRKELSRDVGTAQYEDETIKFEEKSKGTTKCEKRIVTCDVGTAQCEDEIVKCEKKVREPLNVTKELSHVMLELHNVTMEQSNVKKNKKGNHLM